MAWAHSQNDVGERHDLVAHLRGAAALAAKFAAPFGGQDAAHNVGIWHDLGKFHQDFQDYLAACDEARAQGNPPPARSVDHKGAGASVAERLGGPLAFLVAGHHGGLHDAGDLRARLTEWHTQPRIAEALRVARLSLAYEPAAAIEPPAWALYSRHALELFLRMLFSCLVDADFLDTEAHFTHERGALRASVPALADLRGDYARAMAARSGHGTDPVSRLRHEVFRACEAAGDLAPGLFRLTVPTGGGKTLAALGFALQHALQHGQERVVVAVPYTSITEQTADVYRSIFQALPGAVLEHHSAMAPRRDPEDADGGPQWERLAAENWDAPLVVTTTVRLFESLFASRTSDCRRLHRLANSIIVLDEAQTMPTHLLTSLLDVLRELAAHYRVSVVFCTATQPALDETPEFRGLANVREIAPDPPRLFRALNRVHYHWPQDNEPRAWDWVAGQMHESPQALAIVNTKDDAVALLAARGDAALHLSTSLCGEHRRGVLAEVRRRLFANEPCQLVTTQVVEAGVDIDFPLVLRAFAPLDRIVQAAGRCNREGRLPAGGRLIVFEPEGQHMPPGVYRTGTDLARMMLQNDEIDPNDPATFVRYFRRLFQNVDLDPHHLQQLRAALRFREVAAQARVIEDDGVTVLVPYQTGEQDHRVQRLLARLRAEPGVSRGLMRELQAFTVAVRRRQVAQFERDGVMEEIQPGIYWWRSTYDRVRGLVATGLTPEQFII